MRAEGARQGSESGGLASFSWAICGSVWTGTGLGVPRTWPGSRSQRRSFSRPSEPDGRGRGAAPESTLRSPGADAAQQWNRSDLPRSVPRAPGSWTPPSGSGRGRPVHPAPASRIASEAGGLGGGERDVSASVFQADMLLTLPHTAPPSQPGPCCQRNLPKILFTSHPSPAQHLPAVASHCLR